MHDLNLIKPLLPLEHDTRINWQVLGTDSMALALAEAARMHNGPIVFISADSLANTRLADALTFFLNDELPVVHFPDWETLPYDCFSPHQDIISERLASLARLPLLQHGIILLSVNTLMQRIAPKHHLAAHSLMLNQGERLDLNAFRLRLQQSGYYCVDQVMAPGEFSVRGSILDIYPMGCAIPYRIDLFDDEIDSIRIFDPENQLSIERVNEINLLPAQEFPFNEEGITRFRQAWRLQFEGNPSQCPIYQDVSQGRQVAGIEYYLPLFFEQTSTLFDYLPTASLLVRDTHVATAAEEFWQQILARYDQLAHDRLRPILPPAQVFLPTQDVFAAMKTWPQIQITDKASTGATQYTLPAYSLPNLQINHKEKAPFQALQQFISSLNGRLLFCSESPGRREALLELLHKIPITCKTYSNWASFLNDDQTIGLCVATIDQGFQLAEAGITLIAESQLFGQQAIIHRRQKTTQSDPQAMVRDLMELDIGAPIVHIEHGIGRYQGLQNLSINGQTGEYLTLVYADDNKVYVPVTSLHLINRYTGMDSENAPLHHLGSKQWSSAKRKAAEKIHDAAAELLEIFAKRAAQSGFSFPKPDEQYYCFANDFPFEETPDQQQAIEHVIDDMTSDKKMERLICGDVGFGKTEVAMRAAFLAAYAGKQVAVFVPTTLLAQQHYSSFADRFADWPIKVAVLSRFKSQTQQNELIAQLATGNIDIVIGTHRLLNPSIKFNKLGLLIIDEEHRFGVQHKERIRAQHAHIDTLTLTATPIPRTLNMAFSGMRDLSIIATPPARRLAIKTFLHEREHSIIREAILREHMRGGQVYFLHNKVESIQRIADELQNLVPSMRIGIAHGQLPERQLEQVMRDFYQQRFNILLCTTIIESGIDVPTANTMIIDNADRFGLAQLHQIRGRVGRSHHQAYAYLLTNPDKKLTRDAHRRLEALTELDDLGSGFSLATHDLEIRGAGELLGEQQSGHMQAIGFTLYMELLKRAVDSLKSGEAIQLEQQAGAEIDLQIAALIPDDYVPDVHTRLTLYKRLANAKQADDLAELQVEFIDRFGPVTQEVKHLFAITRLKLRAQPLGIKKLNANPRGGRIEFAEQPNVDPLRIIHLVQQQAEHFKLDGPERLRFTFTSKTAEERLAIVNQVIDALS